MRTTVALPIVTISPKPVCLPLSAESTEALLRVAEARLKSVEDEILRLVRLASEADDRKLQQTYLDLAQDLQREARGIRIQLSECLNASWPTSWSAHRRWIHSLRAQFKRVRRTFW